jgi:peptide/nickel transport system permease protein
MVMACFRNSAFDIANTTVALIWQAAPPFTTGIALLMLLSYRLDLFPSGGMVSPGVNAARLTDIVFSADFARHLVLPTICITGYYIATPMLIMRDSMLDVLNSDYVEFARAKGLAPLRVILAHAARNALMSLVTVCGVLLGFAIGGQVVVETVFSWPGMGSIMVDAASAQDYPVAQGAFLMLAAVIVIANLLADISYGFLDPRVRTGAGAR